MFYAEIDKNGKCFHITQDKLPLSDTILLAEENVFGKIRDGENWVEDDTPIPEPTPDPIMEKLDSIEAKIQTNEDLQTFYDDIVKEVGL